MINNTNSKHKKTKEIFASILISIPFVMTQNSCSVINKPKINRFNFQEVYQENDTFDKYNNSIFFDNAKSYKNLVTNKLDFVLFIESDTCLSCREFIQIKNNVINKTNVLTYSISLELFKTIQTDLNYTKTKILTPLTLIYNDGEICKEATSEKYPDIYKNEAKFEKFLNSNIQLTNLYIDSAYEIKQPTSSSLKEIYFTNNIDDKQTSTLYKHKNLENNKVGYIFLFNFKDTYAKPLLENDLYILSKGYSNYRFSYADYSTKFDENLSTTLSLSDQITAGKNISIPKLSLDEEENIIKTYQIIGISYYSTGTFKNIKTELLSYEEIALFIEENK